MGAGLEHAPLAIFTTLAPMAAASFVLLAFVFIAMKPSAEQARRLDRWTALPAACMALGMVAAFFHLANPLNALFVFSGVGSSPLSNELLVAVIFAVVALVYWLLGLAGKLPASGGVRTVLLVVLAVGSVAQAVFCGLAYMIPTIPTWNDPATVLQQLGCAWLGGAALGVLVCALAKVPLSRAAQMFAIGFAAAGLVVALAGEAMQGALVQGVSNIWGPASALAPQMGVQIALFAVLGVAVCVLLFMGGRGSAVQEGAQAAAMKRTDVLAAAALVAAIVGILIARFAFYGLFMGIAL